MLPRSLVLILSLLLAAAARGQQEPNVVTTIRALPATVGAGEPLSFELVFDNRGAAAAPAFAARLFFASPVNPTAQLVSVSGEGWLCSDPLRGGEADCRRNGLAAGASATLRVDAIAPLAPGRVVIQTILTGSVGQTQSTWEVGVLPVPPVTNLVLETRVDREDDPARAAFRIIATARNDGPGVARDVTIRFERTGFGFVFRRGEGHGWTCTSRGERSTCTHAALEPGRQTSVAFYVYGAYERAGDIGRVVALMSGADANVNDNTAVVSAPAVAIASPRPEEFETILIPIAVDGPGANGSQWQTTLTLHNATSEPLIGAGAFDLFYPYHPFCGLQPCPPAPSIARDATVQLPISVPPSVATGTLLQIRKSLAPRVALELRTQDVSRQALTWGTEIPVVRESQLHTGTITLLDVPLDARFRQTLRMYDVSSAAAPAVHVRIFDLFSGAALFARTIPLLEPASQTTPFRSFPAYAELPNFALLPELAATSRVRIELTPVVPGMRHWAFASVTNNETQHVTTVTP